MNVFWRLSVTLSFLVLSISDVAAATDEGLLKARFLKAAHEDDLDSLKLIIEGLEDVDTDWTDDEESNTALHYAVENANQAMALYLLENGADIDAQNAEEQTPLHLAVIEDDIRIVQFLLTHGANFRITSKEGSALLVAVEHGSKASLRALKNFMISQHLKENPEDAKKRRKIEL